MCTYKSLLQAVLHAMSTAPKSAKQSANACNRLNSNAEQAASNFAAKMAEYHLEMILPSSMFVSMRQLLVAEWQEQLMIQEHSSSSS